MSSQKGKASATEIAIEAALPAPAERGRDDHAEHFADRAAGQAMRRRLKRETVQRRVGMSVLGIAGVMIMRLQVAGLRSGRGRPRRAHLECAREIGDGQESG